MTDCSRLSKRSSGVVYACTRAALDPAKISGLDEEHQSTVGGRPLMATEVDEESSGSFSTNLMPSVSQNVRDTSLLHLEQFKVGFSALFCFKLSILGVCMYC